MNILLFIVVVAVSFIVVRIGAIAFQLTGIEWSMAKFQALSCFTSTGFTTREAELVTSDPRRRKIASILIILGNAGLVTLVATFANSLRPWNVLEQLEIPFISQFILKGASLWVNLAIIVLAVYLLYRVFTSAQLTRKFTDYLRSKLVEKHFADQASLEELQIAPQGYTVSKILITSDSPIANRRLRDLELDLQNITTLAVIRAAATIANPSPRERILPGDEFVCFGVSSTIHKILLPQQQKPPSPPDQQNNQDKDTT